jgi:outer membrane cobalamin receptor
VGPQAAMAGATSSIRSGRSRTFTEEDPPVLVVDGIRVNDPNSVLHELPASEIDVLEVLPGSVAGWEYGASGAAGVIKITLKKGVPDGAPQSTAATECVVPDFPRG